MLVPCTLPVPSDEHLAELLWRAARDEAEHRRRALERAGRAARFWEEEAAAIAGSGRALTELQAVADRWPTASRSGSTALGRSRSRSRSPWVPRRGSPRPRRRADMGGDAVRRLQVDLLA